MARSQVRVMIPKYFEVEMSAEQLAALNDVQKEDMCFDAIGKYPEVDLRMADCTDLEWWELDPDEYLQDQ